jgi:hypothetical protein
MSSRVPIEPFSACSLFSDENTFSNFNALANVQQQLNVAVVLIFYILDHIFHIMQYFTIANLLSIDILE